MQRYRIKPWDAYSIDIVPDESGRWVKYDEALAIIESQAATLERVRRATEEWDDMLPVAYFEEVRDALSSAPAPEQREQRATPERVRVMVNDRIVWCDVKRLDGILTCVVNDPDPRDARIAELEAVMLKLRQSGVRERARAEAAESRVKELEAEKARLQSLLRVVGETNLELRANAVTPSQQPQVGGLSEHQRAVLDACKQAKILQYSDGASVILPEDSHDIARAELARRAAEVGK